MTYIERIINVETNEVTERPYTAAESAEVESKKAALVIELQKAEETGAAKQALLNKLGITEDEAKLLLG